MVNPTNKTGNILDFTYVVNDNTDSRILAFAELTNPIPGFVVVAPSHYPERYLAFWEYSCAETLLLVFRRMSPICEDWPCQNPNPEWSL